MLFIVKWFKILLIFIWTLFLLALGAWVSAKNSTPITLNIFAYELPELASGVYICLALFVGLILGFVSYWISVQGRIFLLKRDRKRLEREVHQLRTSPLNQPSSSTK